MWRRETTNDVNLVGKGNGVTCVSKREKGMCSSGIAWVRAGSRLFGRDIKCVWERGVRAREREEERGERGVVCVRKWHVDREAMLMLFESGLCTEMQGKRVIMCVIETS
jgi:hypothetical protein